MYSIIRSCTLNFSGKYVLQTDVELIMRKKVLLPGQGTNYTVHGLSQLLLVHTRKRESKERLDLGKKFPESNLPSTQKGHDYGRATFARVTFFKRIQLLLEMVMQIIWSCCHGQRKYQYQYAWWEDCLPNEPFQNFKLYQERFHLPDRAAVSTFDPHELTRRLGWTISSIIWSPQALIWCLGSQEYWNFPS